MKLHVVFTVKDNSDDELVTLEIVLLTRQNCVPFPNVYGETLRRSTKYAREPLNPEVVPVFNVPVALTYPPQYALDVM